jgi:uncharacterized protein
MPFMTPVSSTHFQWTDPRHISVAVGGRLRTTGEHDVNDATHTGMETFGGAAARGLPGSGEFGPAERARGSRGPVDCGDLPFLIRRDGTWLYRGSPINRKELVCLFASVLIRDEAGGFVLETPAERGRIQVEDAPFVAVELDWVGCGRGQKLTFRTNVDELITAGSEHPIRIAHDILTCEPTPYIRVRGTQQAPVEARISRAVYYELVALAEPGMCHTRRMLGVWSDGIFFPLGELPENTCRDLS